MSRSLPIAILGALAALAVVLACAINPVSKRPEFVVMSRATELKLGEEEARKVAQEMGIVEDAAISAYVRDVGERLAQYSLRDDVEFQFLVVDSEIINAFALPGGHIYVTRGLLARVNSEDELANVLGHEIGHVDGRHAVQRVTRSAPLAVATGIPAAAVGLVLPGIGRGIGEIGQFAGSLALAPYSRSQESASDRLGQEMAAKAGWDPMALARFMHTLEREEQLSDAKGPPSFLRTHPLTHERVENSTAYAAELQRAPADPIAASHAEFLAELEGLLVGEDPAQGIFRENVFLHPDLELWLEFPEGWEYRNGSSFVAAIGPGDAARIVLIAAEGEDPLSMARAFAKGEGAAFGMLPKATRLGRYPGARAYGRSGGATVDVSWVAFGGYVYQITGVCKNRDYDQFQTPFIDVALSIRPLTATERAGVMEERLRIAEARSDEPLSSLVERTDARWSVEQTAVANALEADARLGNEQPVKVPIAQLYEKR